MIFRLGNGEGEEESSAPHSRGLFTIRGVGAKRLMALIAPINSCLQASYDLRLKEIFDLKLTYLETPSGILMKRNISPVRLQGLRRLYECRCCHCRSG